MFLRDGLPLYDLPETSRRLLRGPAWLRRQARSQAVPAAWVDGSLGFAAPWVDAACGERPDDPEAVATYWCARLAPPPPGAHRALADRAELPLADDELLDAEDAARRLYASAAALTRLEIMVLDAADGAVQARWRWDRSGLPEGETLARLLAFSRDGRTLWTRGYSERLWGWPAGGGPPVNPYAGHRQGVDRMALSRDGRELTVLGLDHRSHAWDVDAARPGDGRATPWP